MTPSGIEPVTFQFVAQYLNHCATTVPHKIHGVLLKAEDNSTLYLHLIHFTSVYIIEVTQSEISI
jgi:hypothetical protein